MKTSVLGTGMVGQTIAQKLVELGHEVFFGTRNADETKARTQPNPMTGVAFADWHKNNSGVQVVNYGDIPADTEIFVNATSGSGSVAALQAVGKDKHKNKVILDIANPLDFSKGMPPSLSIVNTDSLGEHIQKAFPESHVVKSLNTLNAFLMVNPARLSGDHSIFISGNNQDAKSRVISLLHTFGWKKEAIIDLGDITTARGTEMMLPIWLRLYALYGSAEFNFHVVRK